MSILSTLGTKTADLATVPLNLVGGLFGNPFDPLGGHQVINTKSQINYLNNLANQTNEKRGILSYDDYGTKFNLSDLKDPTAFSTAMTMGGTGFTKSDTGDITYSGGKYDFDGAVPFIDEGGLMGKAYNLGGKAADLVRGIRQNSPGVRGTSYFDDIDISQPPGTNVGIMSNLRNLFSSSAMANEPMVNVDNVKSAINAARNREALNRQGLMALDDAGLISDPYETFTQVAKPGFNKQFAKQLGSTALSFITKNPLVALFTKGLGALAGRGGFTGVRGGQNLYGDTTFNTFGKSTSLADFLQRRRDKRAREEAARIGAEKQKAIIASQQVDTGGGPGSRPGGFGQGAGDFSPSDPTATEGSF